MPGSDSGRGCWTDLFGTALIEPLLLLPLDPLPPLLPLGGWLEPLPPGLLLPPGCWLEPPPLSVPPGRRRHPSGREAECHSMNRPFQLVNRLAEVRKLLASNVCALLSFGLSTFNVKLLGSEPGLSSGQGRAG